MFEQFKQAGYHDATYLHREILLNYIVKYNPESVLDVGCGSCADLWLLKQTLPETKFTGIDRDPSNLDGVTIIKGNIQTELPKLTEKYDIIYTNGVLMYLTDEDKEAAIDNMLRLATKAIILSEINPYDPKPAFDYDTYFTNKGFRVITHKTPPQVRADTQWSHNGYVYEIVIG